MILEASLARRAASPPGLLHAEVSEAISLDSGYAFPETLPDMSSAAQRALNAYRSQSLQYGPPFGLRELREWIAGFMRDDATHVSPDEILIVNGAKRGLDLICRLLADEGDYVVVTAPTYFTAIPILRSFGLSFIEAEQDEQGLDVDALMQRLAEHAKRGRKRPKFIYNVSDFHNPTGVTIPGERRESLIALAREYGIPIVEDSPYRKLRFEGTSQPSLKSLDRDDLVFAVGTFSKLLAPGLRVGWVCAPPPLLERMAKLTSDGGTCPLTQRTILEYAKSDDFARHLETLRTTYAAHRDCMVNALRRELPEAKFVVPQGGYYLWLEFPADTDTDVLAKRAYHAGVSGLPGSAFFAGDYAHADRAPSRKNYMRLAYSFAKPSEIERGIAELAASYRTMYSKA